MNSIIRINLYLLFALVGALFLVSACQNTTSQEDDSGQAKIASGSDTQKINRLLTLIDQRLNFAPDVAKSKWNSRSPVGEPNRESKILSDVSAQTRLIEKEKCDPNLVRRFFQDQFNAGKIIQTNLLISWQKEHPAKHKFSNAPNLARDIRPQLDKLTPELITAFCDVQTILSDPGSRRYLRSYLFSQANNVIRGDVNGAVRRQALMVFQSPGSK